jgi:hypothetical protein
MHYHPITKTPKKISRISITKSTYGPAEATRTLIKSGWEKAKKEMKKKKWSFYEGPLLRFEGLDTTGSETIIKASTSITYRDVVGIRAHNAKTVTSLPENDQPRALSVMSILKTTEGSIILGIRASGDWDRSFEIPGGFVRTNEGNVCDSIQNRLFDDYGLHTSNISESTLIGFIEVPEIQEMMCVFLHSIDLPFHTLQRVSKKPDIYSLRDNETAWNSFKKAATIHEPSAMVIDAYFEGMFDLS